MKPSNKNKPLSIDEIFKIIDSNDDEKYSGLDDFERDAVDGLRLVKDRDRLNKINERIEEELNKKNNNKKIIFWLSVAASLVIVIGITYFIYPNFNSNKDQVAQKISDSLQINEPTINSDQKIMVEPKKEKNSVFVDSSNLNLIKNKINANTLRKDSNILKRASNLAVSDSYKEKQVIFEEDSQILEKTSEERTDKNMENNLSGKIVAENRISSDVVSASMASNQSSASAKNVTVASGTSELNNYSGKDKIEINTKNDTTSTLASSVSSSSLDNSKFLLNEVVLVSKTVKKNETKKGFTKGKNQVLASLDTSKELLPFVYGEIVLNGANNVTEDLESGDDDLVFKSSTVPKFPGGFLAMQKYFRDNVKQSKSNERFSGLIDVSFAVAKDGSISGIKVLKSIANCLECTQEVIRVVKLMPKWLPGTSAGKPIEVRFHLPVRF